MPQRSTLFARACAISAVFATSLCTHHHVIADEIPLGGRFDQFTPLFNAAAAKMKLDVSVAQIDCGAPSQCNVSFGDGVAGHISAVDDDKPILETALISHDCNNTHADILRDVSKVVVSMFSGKRASTQGHDKLAAAIRSPVKQQISMVIDGIEFVNSNISCTLLIARPQKD